MGIAFRCGGCGRWLEVDAALAGKRGRCRRCEHVNVVPAAEEDDGSAVYAMEGPAEAPIEAEAPEAIFVRAPAEPDPPPTQAPRPRRRKAKRKVRAVRDEGSDSPWAAWRWPIRLALGAVAVLVGVALLVPGGTMMAGIALAVVGLLVIAVGYAIAAYAAFKEDALHGWLFLAIPLYAGYYIVSRWDVMWPWFGTMAAGVAVLVVAGWVLGIGLERAGPPEKPSGDGEEVRVIEPAHGRLVAVRVGA
jgi:hypothetical protein